MFRGLLLDLIGDIPIEYAFKAEGIFMTVPELSIILGGDIRRVAEVIRILAMNDINIRAVSYNEDGTLRMITDHTGAAITLLEKKGFEIEKEQVIAVEVPDDPGGLARVMDIFSRNNIEILHFYSSLDRDDRQAAVIFRMKDINSALKVAGQHHIISLANF